MQDHREEDNIQQGDGDVVPPPNRGGVEGGGTDTTGGVPGEEPEQGGVLRDHPPNPGDFPGVGEAGRGTGEAEVTGEAGNQGGGRRVARRGSRTLREVRDSIIYLIR